MKPRVLLGTPLYGSPCPEYVSGLVSILKMEDAEYIPMFSRGTYLSANRQMLVEEARRLKCDEILFIDSDLACSSEHVKRIRSHDVDVVGGIYPKKRSGEPEWLVHANENQSMDALQPVNSIAAGFLRVKMSVFDRLDAKFPERRYKNMGEEPKTEYFPMGLMMPDSHEHPAERKLARILATLRGFVEAGATQVSPESIIALLEPKKGSVTWSGAAPDEFPQQVGEDYGLCRILRSAGITIYADLGCRLRHVGPASYPLEETPL